MHVRPGLPIALAAALAACADDAAAPADEPLAPYAGEELSGGDTTVFDTTRDAYARPARNMDQAGRNEFALGDHLFNRGWVTAPASAEGNDGLGPLYNAASCSACHGHDGRGAPPEGPDDDRTFGLLVRLSVPGEAGGAPAPEPTYGEQLQPFAILGVPAEGRAAIAWEEVPGTYADGTAYSLRRPSITFVDLGYGPLADGVMVSPRVGQQLVGLGLLAAIDEEAILAREDADDADGDGISGRAHRVVDAGGAARVGRFGWKASQPTIEGQTSAAFLGDMGITSPLLRDQECSPAQEACLAAPTGGDPEIDESKVARIAFYLHMLAVPARRDVGDPEVLRGRTLFEEAGCGSCHVARHRTGELEGFPWLSGQDVWPYTDLLLHDMGDELADGRPDGDADGREWRTPPLWGIGLLETVSRHELLLHDGRARGFAEAILWHGGEGAASREAFRAMDAADREALLAFLRSL